MSELELRKEFHDIFIKTIELFETAGFQDTELAAVAKRLKPNGKGNGSIISQLKAGNSVARTYFNFLRAFFENGSTNPKLTKAFPKLIDYVWAEDSPEAFDLERYRMFLAELKNDWDDGQDDVLGESADQPSQSLEPTFWIGYQWGVKEVEVSLIELRFGPAGALKGPASFSFFDKIEQAAKPQQDGVFRVRGSNLTIYTTSKPKKELQTFILLKLGQKRLGDLTTGINLVGSYTTVHYDQESSCGAIWLEKADSETEARQHIREILSRKRLLTPRQETNPNRPYDLTQMPLSPLAEADVRAEITYFLYNKRIDTRFKGLNQPFHALADQPYLDRIRAVEAFAGVYRGDYVDVGTRQAQTCLMVVHSNGRTFLRMPDETVYWGFFRAVRGGDILIGLFEKDALKEYHRLRIVLDAKRTHIGSRYYGLYSGIDRQTNFPVMGRIRFEKIKTFKPGITNVGQFLSQSPGRKPTANWHQLLGEDRDLVDFLTGLKEQKQHRFGDSAAFYRDLLAESGLSWEAVIAQSQHETVSEAGQRFEGTYLGYSLRSTTQKTKIQRFPIQIHKNGTVEIKSRSGICKGTTTLIGEILVLNFTRNPEGKPYALTKQFLVRKRNATEKDSPSHYSGLSISQNSNSALRAGREVLYPTQEKWAKLQYEPDISRPDLVVRQAEEITSFLSTRLENLILVEENPGTVLRVKTNLEESFMAAACFFAQQNDRGKVLEHLRLAFANGFDDHRFIRNAVTGGAPLSKFKDEVLQTFHLRSTPEENTAKIPPGSKLKHTRHSTSGKARRRNRK